jgi:hypothetical protein
MMCIFFDFKIFCQMQASIVCSPDDKGGNWYKLQVPSTPERGPGSECVAYVVFISSTIIRQL